MQYSWKEFLFIINALLVLYCIFVYFKNMADKTQPFTRY